MVDKLQFNCNLIWILKWHFFVPRILYKGSTVESVYKDDAEIFLNPNDLSTGKF